MWSIISLSAVTTLRQHRGLHSYFPPGFSSTNKNYSHRQDKQTLRAELSVVDVIKSDLIGQLYTSRQTKAYFCVLSCFLRLCCLRHGCSCVSICVTSKIICVGIFKAWIHCIHAAWKSYDLDLYNMLFTLAPCLSESSGVLPRGR